jgi:hypothetical protein
MAFAANTPRRNALAPTNLSVNPEHTRTVAFRRQCNASLEGVIWESPARERGSAKRKVSRR